MRAAVLLIVALAPVSVAQQTFTSPPFASQGPAQMVAIDMNALCVRLIQLMEAGGVAVPDLQRAAAPMLDNVRRSCSALQALPGAGQATYSLVRSVDAYLGLFEAVPKPYPFPDVARDQFREFRDLAVRLDAHFVALLDSKEAELRSPDRDRTTYFQEENRLLPPPKPNGRRVVFLGDSITTLWRLNEYFPDEDFINRGIIGQLSGQLLTRIRADVVALKPSALVLQAGTFDLARNVALPTIEDNFTSIADIAESNNIKLIVTSLLPVSEAHKERPQAAIVALNDWIKSFCARRACNYVDFYTVLADAQGVMLADVSDDGLHPNSKGYRLMAPILGQAVEQATKPTTVKPAPQAPPIPATPVKPRRQK
jgi:lysophospholipase L1-like esterase